LEIAAVSQHLQLLADFLPNVAVQRVKAAQTRLEGVDLIEAELPRSNIVDALENIEEPSA
jgi:hypothetical protein